MILRRKVRKVSMLFYTLVLQESIKLISCFSSKDAPVWGGVYIGPASELPQSARPRTYSSSGGRSDEDKENKSGFAETLRNSFRMRNTTPESTNPKSHNPVGVGGRLICICEFSELLLLYLNICYLFVRFCFAWFSLKPWDQRVQWVLYFVLCLRGRRQDFDSRGTKWYFGA